MDNLQSKIFRDKVIQTNLERYGVEHHSQNAEVADKMLKKSYNKTQEFAAASVDPYSVFIF